MLVIACSNGLGLSSLAARVPAAVRVALDLARLDLEDEEAPIGMGEHDVGLAVAEPPMLGASGRARRRSRRVGTRRVGPHGVDQQPVARQPGQRSRALQFRPAAHARRASTDRPTSRAAASRVAAGFIPTYGRRIAEGCLLL